jgi:hypothetical protein
MATLSAVTLGVGAAAVAAGGVLWLIGVRKDRVSVRPEISARGAGASLVVSY